MLLQFLCCLATAAAEMAPKIVGGTEARIKDWPFMAFVSIDSPEVVATCGGTLLSSQTVLTAAHCLDDLTFSKIQFDLFHYSILMGHREFQKAKFSRKVLDYETHQDYDQFAVANDIGIMFLVQPVTFSSTVKKVILMKTMSYKKDTYLETAGWGVWSVEKSGNSPVLKSLPQILMSKKKCEDYIDDEESSVGVICAGKINDTEFTYSGDSGGPLVKAGHRRQLGIVSFSILENPGVTVYTCIPYFYDWIEDTQKQLFQYHCSNREPRKYKLDD